MHALREEIPGLGEIVSFDVKHIYAWVRENNPRVSIAYRFSTERRPTGDPDCRVGVKRATNQERADGSRSEKKEYLWGYGSGVAAVYNADYGDIILAEYTQPFNKADVTYFLPLYWQAVAALGFYPTHITADAAFDAQVGSMKPVLAMMALLLFLSMPIQRRFLIPMVCLSARKAGA